MSATECPTSHLEFPHSLPGRTNRSETSCFSSGTPSIKTRGDSKGRRGVSKKRNADARPLGLCGIRGKRFPDTLDISYHLYLCAGETHAKLPTCSNGAEAAVDLVSNITLTRRCDSQKTFSLLQTNITHCLVTLRMFFFFF